MKLSKCYFVQLVTHCLGFVVGRGVRALDPDKVQAVLAWDRPTRSRDTEGFLGFTNFLRSHCAGEYSDACRSLRELTSAKIEKTGSLRERRKALEGRVEASEVFGNGDLVSMVPEVVWLRPDLPTKTLL